MRLILLFIYLCCSCLSIGQDSLHIDTSLNEITSTEQFIEEADSDSSTSKAIKEKAKKKKKKVKKSQIKEEPLISTERNTMDVNASEKDYGIILLGVFLTIIVLGVVIALYRSLFDKTFEHSPSKDLGFISDYLSRITLSRRDYYRNIYLKSDARQRKRYVVLKRDNWKCVFCSGQATQVHHTRYAKRNIGKEPIEWLVSVCKTCHDSEHD